MKTFTVSLDRHDIEFSFEANNEKLPFDLHVVNNENELQQQILLQQQQIEQILQQIKQGIDQVVDSAKNQQHAIADAAMSFAEEFVRVVFENDTDSALAKVKSQLDLALAKFDVSTRTRIFVHPEFAQAITEQFKSAEFPELEFQPDPLLEKSDCRVEGPESGWIARIENQLELARENLFESLGGGDS